MSKNYDFCAICGKYGKLSFDHIPPQSCGNNQNVYYYSFQQFVTDPKLKFKKNHSQNGVKSKNICSECNNLLGSKYDPELSKLKNIAIESFKGNQLVDKSIDVKKIIKSVFGHYLSISPYDQKTTMDEEMTSYFWDHKNNIYEGYSLYMFLYPYKDTIYSFKNYLVSQVSSDGIALPNGMLSCLYFYPFAFIFMEKQKFNRGVDLIRFVNSNQSSFEVNNGDWIFKNKILSPIWPCNPEDDGTGSSFVMYNDKLAKNSILKHW